MNQIDGQAYVWVPPGVFTMGCSSGDLACGPYETPAHLVQITRGFWIGQTKVTRDAWSRNALLHKLGSADEVAPDNGLSDRVDDKSILVKITDAEHFCQTVGLRLPTEAEWEYSARNGIGTPVSSEAFKDTWGLSGLLNGRAEWVSDRFTLYFPNPAKDPIGPRSGDVRTLRGDPDAESETVRASSRDALDLERSKEFDRAAFRCAGALPSQ